jgi:hypothetical protein
LAVEVADREPTARADLAVAAALTILAALLYAVTAPAVVNTDGLGYIKLLPHNFAAGHLLYMPILRCATAICGDGLLAGRAVSVAAGASSVALLFACARALLPRFASVLAAAGLAVSYGAWVQGSDVEAYACALAALLALFALALAYRASPSLPRALCVGLALSGAVLLHLTHVIVTPFVAIWILAHARDRKSAFVHAAMACATGGAITVAGYAWAALHVRKLDLPAAIAWIRTAGHGFVYEGGFGARLADSTYGLAKAFVWSPYLYESNAQTLLKQFLLGLLPLLAVLALVVARWRRLSPLPRGPLVVWMASYAAMALAFFGSDHERWVFLLPPLWLLAAAAVASLGKRRAFAGAALVAYLAAANGETAIGPAHEDAWIRIRADAAASLMRDGDLVLFPGHSWDEYIGFYTHTKVVPMPIVYYLGRDGREKCLARLDKELREARERHARIFAVRIFEDPEDSRGFFELKQLGMPPEELRSLLGRFHPVPLPTVEPKVTVWRLDD